MTTILSHRVSIVPEGAGYIVRIVDQDGTAQEVQGWDGEPFKSREAAEHVVREITERCRVEMEKRARLS